MSTVDGVNIFYYSRFPVFRNFKFARTSYCLMIVLLTLGFYFTSFEVLTTTSPKEILNTVTMNGDRRYFAVFGCSTPDSTSHRRFDYVFYLPLTALAWQRIGFESIILIIGERYEWEGDPILSLTLEALNRLEDVVTVIFIPAKAENRGMLSQTSRIFLANMNEFPGRSTDFIITSDADLWPLRKEHFFPPPSTDWSLFLVHSGCCGQFKFSGRSYKMLPMSHIGANASTWQQIVNTDSSKIANDSSSILAYFQQDFGDRVYQRVQFASADWYLDQKLVSIRIDEWIKRQNSNNTVFKVSDAGFSRIDRSSWKQQTNRLKKSSLKIYFDAHLIVDGFSTKNWVTVKPLIVKMYSKTTWQVDWIDQYAINFNTRYVKWIENQNVTIQK